MKKAKFVEEFPYMSKLVCYIQVLNDGAVEQIENRKEQIEAACLRVKYGESKLYAVWPGKYKSDLFEIDDINAVLDAFGIEHADGHVHEVEYSISDLDDGKSTYATVDLKFKCGCKLRQNNIKGIAKDLKNQLGWDMTTSTGFGRRFSNDDCIYSVRILRSSINNKKQK